MRVKGNFMKNIKSAIICTSWNFCELLECVNERRACWRISEWVTDSWTLEIQREGRSTCFPWRWCRCRREGKLPWADIPPATPPAGPANGVHCIIMLAIVKIISSIFLLFFFFYYFFIIIINIIIIIIILIIIIIIIVIIHARQVSAGVRPSLCVR